MKLVPGLYESLINQFIEAGIEEAASQQLRPELRALDLGDSHTYLAQYLAERIGKAFSSIPYARRLENASTQFSSLFAKTRAAMALQCLIRFSVAIDYVSHQGSRPMSIIWRLRHKSKNQ